MLRNDTWAHFEYMSAFVSTKLPNNRKSNQLMSSFLPFAVSTIARLRLDALEKQTVTPRSFSSRTLKTVPRNEKVWLRHLTAALVYTELHNVGSPLHSELTHSPPSVVGQKLRKEGAGPRRCNTYRKEASVTNFYFRSCFFFLRGGGPIKLGLRPILS